MATASIPIKERIKATTKAKTPTKTKPKVVQHTKEFWKKVSEFEEKFYELMYELNLYNKFDDTYTLHILEETEYGFFAKLYLKTGLTFNELKDKQTAIQQNLQCLWVMKTKQFQNYADVQIITTPLNEKIPYVNPNIKPWEMYLGLNFSQKPIINDNNDNHMFLVTGAIGSGKTRFLYQILLSWILGCKPSEVEIYLCDIAKNEFINFQRVEHVKAYAYEIKQLGDMMKEIRRKLDERNIIISQLREKGVATNIAEYNAISKNKWAYIYLVIDEFSILIPDKTDTEEEREIKEEVIDTIKRMSKLGRSLGIFNLNALQKASKEEMQNGNIAKNMSSVRISFRQNDVPSSEVVIGDSSAVGLSPRYAVYSLNGIGGNDYLFSPYLSTEMLNDMLRPHIKKGYKVESKKATITNELIICTQELPKEMTRYNPSSSFENKPTVWNLDVKCKPLVKPSVEVIDLKNPKFKPEGDDCEYVYY